MNRVRAIVVDPEAPGRVAIREVEAPVPLPGEAVVQVLATSVNLGDVYRLPTAQAGWRPGWDVAGVVAQAAADGTGPAPGTRVLGLRGERFGAWAEQVAVPTAWLAELPAQVSLAAAATLPTAGLTALYGLERYGLALNARALVTGASGGVGHLACQLAQQAGARVVAAVRRPERVAAVHKCGISDVVVGEDLGVAAQHGPYELILDLLGGQPLATVLPMLVPDGLCLSLGISAGLQTTLDLARLAVRNRGFNLSQVILFTEMELRPPARRLAALAQMVAEGRLRPLVDVEAPWTDVAEVARQFTNREITGKAVLHLTP
jgi:NADPH:quinone reductase